MTHIFKWSNKFADVFISKIDDDEITYEVRDKDTGIMTEPKRKTKYIVNEVSRMVHFDAREMQVQLFEHIYQTLHE